MRIWSGVFSYKVLVSVGCILAMAGVSACTRGEVELKNTVTAYTQMLGEALAKPDAEKMKFFASADEIKRIDSYILLMLKERKVMNSTLQKLDFRGVTTEKDKKATVTTYEEWAYYYVDEKSRQPSSKEEKIAYNNVYHLIKDQGHWVVDKIDSNETQAPEQ
jgi:hypothetical protein